MIQKYKEFTQSNESPFYIFGSENSQDYDVLVSVDDIPQNIDDAHNICKYYNDKLSKILTDKPLNCNIGVFDNNKLIKVFKGTCEELNNVLYYTYKNHNQYYPNPISKVVERDINEKILRVARFIITFYSRTHLRPEIKLALRGDLLQKLKVLKKIDFIKMIEFPGKKETLENIYKTLAFQFGQIFSLIDGYEPDSYTKNGVAKNYPDLSNLLNRKSITENDLSVLNKYMERFIEMIESNIYNMRIKEFIN